MVELRDRRASSAPLRPSRPRGAAPRQRGRFGAEGRGRQRREKQPAERPGWDEDQGEVVQNPEIPGKITGKNIHIP